MRCLLGFSIAQVAASPLWEAAEEPGKQSETLLSLLFIKVFAGSARGAFCKKPPRIFRSFVHSSGDVEGLGGEGGKAGNILAQNGDLRLGGGVDGARRARKVVIF